MNTTRTQQQGSDGSDVSKPILLAHLLDLPEKDKKKAAMELLASLSPGDKGEIAEQLGNTLLDLPEKDRKKAAMELLASLPPGDKGEIAEQLGNTLLNLPEKDRKKAAMELLASLSPGDKEKVAEQLGNTLLNRKTVDFIARLIIFAFVFVLIGSFLAFVTFSYLRIPGDLLFTLITTTGGFLAGVFVPSPGSLKRTVEVQPHTH